MKLFAVPVLADYEFVGSNQSGGGEVTKVGIALALNEKDATEFVLKGMEPLKKQSLREGVYSNFRPQKPTELPLDKAGFVCMFN